MGHPGGRVGLAAVRHRRQVGAVGLDQAPIQRHEARHLAQLGGGLEGEDARERDVEAEVQRGARDVHRFREAMEHAARLRARGGVRPFLAQHGQRVVARLAGVDHQRQVHRTAGADVHAKALALPFHVRDGAAFEPEVVEAGLADGDHARAPRAFAQPVDVGFGHGLGVGMHADAGPQVVVGRGQRVHGLELLHRRTDAQRAADVGRAHVREDGRETIVQLGEREVAVGVDVHMNSGSGLALCVP